MKIFNLSPEFKDKIRKFKQLRRAYISFLILLLMFLLSLPAELIFNDFPLMMKVDGKLYFPAFVNYSLKDFGGDSSIPIFTYNSLEFQWLMEGKTVITRPEMIFGKEDPNANAALLKARAEQIQKWRADAKNAPLAIETKSGKPHNIEWIVYAPIRHSYKSTPTGEQLETTALAAPWRKVNKGNGQSEYELYAAKSGHLLGTDREGKDVLARIVYGFRISLFFGLALAATGAFVGTILGAVQGYFGGWVDLFGQRLTEIWTSIPQLFLLMILSAFMSKHFFALSDREHYLLLFGILNLTAWMGIATFMRAEFLRSRGLEYVKAAKSLGLSNFKIMQRHILPNSLTPLVTFIPFNVTAGIMSLVSLDFLGFGVKYPAPSLGQLLDQGKENLHAWWIILPTFLALAVTLILCTFIGEGVRRAFDPRAK